MSPGARIPFGGWCPVVILLLVWPAGAGAFEVNGRQWAQMPIPYTVNPGTCAPLDDGRTFEELVAQAMASWSSAACTELSFEFLGISAGTWEEDGLNTFFCQAEGWAFGEDTAGTTVWHPGSDPMETDVGINQDTLQWLAGGPDAVTQGFIDPVGVIAHELGHFLGFSHSPDPFATMYFGHLPNGIQADIAADDKAGICTLYPNGMTECAIDDDCGPEQTCTTIADVPVCADIHDGPGAFCNKDFIDCDGMCWVSFYECSQVCLFLTMDYLDGYCAPLCNDTECPEGFTCTYLPTYDVSICFLDQPDPDGGPDGEDGGPDGADGGEDAGEDGGEDAGVDAQDAGDGAPDAADEAGQPDDEDEPGSGDDGAFPGEDRIDAGDAESPGESGCGCRSTAGGSPIGWFLLLGLARRRLPFS